MQTYKHYQKISVFVVDKRITVISQVGVPFLLRCQGSHPASFTGAANMHGGRNFLKHHKGCSKAVRQLTNPKNTIEIRLR